MKQLIKPILLTMLLCMMGMFAYAHDISVANADGKTIYYTWSNNRTELSVSYRGNSSTAYTNTYSGNLVIPSKVTYNGKDYPVTGISYSAFQNSYNLTSITIPTSVKSIGSSLFTGCSSLATIIVESGNVTYDSRNNCNAIIKTENNQLIAGCKNTVIPNTVVSIGYGAFYGCSGLTSISIPNSVTSIGYSAFYNCYNITSFTIPSSVTSIGSNAFTGTGIYENTPDGLFYIGNWLCGYKGTMPANTTLSIKEGTIGIASGCLLECAENLVGITIPSSMTSINDGAFSECYKLTSITIPNSVTSIGNGAFELCTSLTSITIPNSVTSIGSYAFNDCSSLTSITIPNSVTSIGNYAFYWCTSLTSITIPGSVNSIGYGAFLEDNSLTSVTICDGVTSIGNGAFECCTSLTSITIPNSVTSIGDGAFTDCI